MKMNFKNTIYILVVIIIAGMGCKLKNEEARYKISGEIKNAPKQKLILQELKFEGLDMTSSSIDTTTTDENGNYNFSFLAKSEGLYDIVLDKEDTSKFELLFINDVKEIKLNSDKKNIKSTNIVGSDNTNALYNFLKEYDKKNEALFLISNNLDVLQDVNGAPSIIDSLQKERSNKMYQLNNYVLNAINESNNPTFIQFALIQCNKRLPIETSQVLAYARAAAEKTKSESLKNFVTAMTNQIKNNIPPSPLSIGQPAPEIAMADPNGKIVTLSSLKGKYVLVDFWASWCGPCRAENPNVVSAFEKFKNKKFTVLGVSLDDDKAAWTEAIKADKLNWQHISDLKKWESTVVNTYQFEGIPFNVLLDTNGIIIAKELRGSALQEKLGSILK